ncbi:MAG TPA: BatD family protein, partial [Candidatus Binatia bacterium]|nr:BatD family protein [Candidatus Binatia bacterium]
MNFVCCKRIVLAAMLCGAMARGQAPTTVEPPTASQILVAQPPVDVDSPVTANATCDPPVATPGEKVFYRVELDAAEGMIRWPEKISFPDGLQAVARAQGQTMQVLPGRYRPLTSFVYELRATNAGQYTIPAFDVPVAGQTVTIPAAGFQCAPAKPDSVPPARALVLQASATNVYLGEPLQLRVTLPLSPGSPIEAVRDIQFNGDGFMNDKSSMRQTIQTVDYNGAQTPAYSIEQMATPIGAGERTLQAQGFTAGRNFSGPITITGKVVIAGGPTHYVLLMSNPVKINVRPLPVAGKLPGFTGGIGKFTIGVPQLSTNRLRVGVPLELKVEVKGRGDVNRLVPPPPPRVND